MISTKMQDALNKQLNEELYSSYLYLAMSAYFEENNLGGMAKWMKLQSAEEYGHAMKFYDFLIRVGSRVKLDVIKKPPLKWTSPKKAFEDAYKHEQFISKNIDNLVNLAVTEKDHATNTFLHWFVDEQVEEESTAQQIVYKFDLISDSKAGLFMLDRELGARGAK